MMEKKYKILHLDDYPVFTEGINDIFLETDIEYFPVNSEEETKEALENNIFDYFIADLMLDDDTHDISNGCRVISDISKKYPDLKIMVLTARPDGNKTIQTLLKGKIIAYLTKDFKPTRFYDQVMNVIQKN